MTELQKLKALIKKPSLLNSDQAKFLDSAMAEHKQTKVFSSYNQYMINNIYAEVYEDGS